MSVENSVFVVTPIATYCCLLSLVETKKSITVFLGGLTGPRSI